MSYWANELREHGRNDFDLYVADELDQLEDENSKLREAAKCFRHFVNMRGGSWSEMLEILNNVLSCDDDRKQEAHQEAIQDERRAQWHEEMRRETFGHRCG